MHWYWEWQGSRPMLKRRILIFNIDDFTVNFKLSLRPQPVRHSFSDGGCLCGEISCQSLAQT